jgi:hypothetical protein
MSDIDELLAKLNGDIAKVKGQTMDGLMAAGRLIQAGAQELVPVKSGELKASAYTRRSVSNPNAVEVGFEAEYAGIIHEDDDMKLEGQQRPDGGGVFWGPAGASHFLRTSVENNAEKALDIVRDYASR